MACSTALVVEVRLRRVRHDWPQRHAEDTSSFSSRANCSSVHRRLVDGGDVGHVHRAGPDPSEAVGFVLDDRDHDPVDKGSFLLRAAPFSSSLTKLSVARSMELERPGADRHLLGIAAPLDDLTWHDLVGARPGQAVEERRGGRARGGSGRSSAGFSICSDCVLTGPKSRRRWSISSPRLQLTSSVSISRLL